MKTMTTCASLTPACRPSPDLGLRLACLCLLAIMQPFSVTAATPYAGPYPYVEDFETGRLVTVTASAEGFEPGSATIEVADATPPQLSLEPLRSSVGEADVGQPVPVRLRRDRGFDVDLTVALSSGDPSELRVPATVVIPAGVRAIDFTCAVVNDGDLDGPQTVPITATAAGFPDATASLMVLDDDVPERRTLGGQVSGELASEIYEVTSDLVIAEGDELGIAPGARLRFSAGRRLEAVGALQARGAPDKPIVFSSGTRLPGPGDWSGIHLDLGKGATSRLEFVELAHATTGLLITGDQGQAWVRDCDIHDHTASGVEVYANPACHIGDTVVRILRNRIHANQTGVLIRSFASGCDSSSNRAALIENEVYDNAEQGIEAVAFGSCVTGCTASSASVGGRWARNFIHHNRHGVVARGNARCWTWGASGYIYTAIQNNLVVSNDQSGLSIEGNFRGVVANNTIVANLAAGLASGVSALGTPKFRNNLLTGNGEGIRAAALPTNEVTSVTHNNVFGNTVNWVNYPPEFGRTTTANAKGTPADAFLNISVEPLFVAAGDYHLDPKSPLVDAGTVTDAPAEDYEGELRLNVPDIGWDETPYEFTGVVTTLADEQDGFLGAGAGDSLREVMLAAEILAGPQSITFAEALRGGTILLSGTQLPTIAGNLTIAGLGADVLAIDAAGRSRVFEIAAGATGRIGGLTLRGGRSGPSTHGGGIVNRGQLVLSQCALDSCQAAGGGGGALANDGGHLTVESCSFATNWAIGSGGALITSGTAVVRDSVFVGNSTSSDGGAIANYATAAGGSLRLERCSLHGNRSVGQWAGKGGAVVSHAGLHLGSSTLFGNQARYGGAVALLGDAILANCTFSGNEATGTPSGGGALWVQGGSARLVNCTVTANRVTGRWYGGGGGVHVDGESAAVTLQNTIVAGNTTVLTGADSSPVANFLVLAGTAEHAGLSNLIGGDPRLGPLQDNGGPTLTHLPFPGSPAIDTGSNELAVDLEGQPLANDQRGFARVQHDRVDLGAVETLPFDLDEDGMPNEWETAHGLDPQNPADAAWDPDHDGASNADEFVAGTDPRASDSVVRIQGLQSQGSQVEVTLLTSADRRYSLQFRERLEAGEWQDVPGSADLPGTGGLMALRDANARAAAFYRVRVALP